MTARRRPSAWRSLADAVIRARAIEVRYQRGGALAVAGVNIDLRPGAGLLITGPRGSGKSSVLRAVLGLAGPGGDITVLGAPPGDPATLRRIGWAPQSWPFAHGLRAREVVEMVAELGGHGRHAAAQAIEESVPTVRDYDVLRLEMMRVRAVTPIWTAVSSGPSLSLGDRGPRVDQLRTRLTSEGLLDAAWQEGDPYDLRLETAVRRYQGRTNLAPSGRMDQVTLRQLNLPPDRRIGQLMANLEQRRWRTRELGRRHIWVNLADFRLEAWEDGQLVREYDVMVGSQASSTPEFSEDMQYIVLNPWWGLPAGSARPRFQSFRRNPGLVREYGFQIYNQAGAPVSVYEIDWSRWGDDWPYRMSQPPGPTNPMGEVKFIFPNRHNVYIHDTTERDQFVRTRRDFSAGCIRVRDPLAMADWVLAGQDGWDRARIDQVAAGSSPTVVWLDNRLPVHIAYWTVVGDPGGNVRYLNDLYRRDGSVIDSYLAAYEIESRRAAPPQRGSAGAIAASFD